MDVLLVASGGALGAVLRYLTGLLIAPPLATLAVNLLGCLAMGFAAFWLVQRADQRTTLFLLTGVLGGFTTFSAFSLDFLRLFESGRLGAAGIYALLSVTGAIFACLGGLALARAVH